MIATPRIKPKLSFNAEIIDPSPKILIEGKINEKKLAEIITPPAKPRERQRNLRGLPFVKNIKPEPKPVKKKVSSP
jgi:hypothetical protein